MSVQLDMQGLGIEDFYDQDVDIVSIQKRETDRSLLINMDFTPYQSLIFESHLRKKCSENVSRIDFSAKKLEISESDNYKLKAITQNSNIYIAGHGSQGSAFLGGFSFIQWADFLAKHLVIQRFTSANRGQLAIYLISCNSGLEGLSNKKSFAQLFNEELFMEHGIRSSVIAPTGYACVNSDDRGPTCIKGHFSYKLACLAPFLLRTLSEPLMGNQVLFGIPEDAIQKMGYKQKIQSEIFSPTICSLKTLPKNNEIEDPIERDKFIRIKSVTKIMQEASDLMTCSRCLQVNTQGEYNLLEDLKTSVVLLCSGQPIERHSIGKKYRFDTASPIHHVFDSSSRKASVERLKSIRKIEMDAKNYMKYIFSIQPIISGP